MTEPAPEPALEPALDQVHALLARREAFTDTSRPSRTDVQRLVTAVADELRAEVLDGEVPVRLRAFASSVIAYGAASLVELSYFPEQAFDGGSTSDQLRTRYLEGLRRLREHLAAAGVLLTPIGGSSSGDGGGTTRRYRAGSVRVLSATAPEQLVTPLPITTAPVVGDGMVVAVSTEPSSSPSSSEQLVVSDPTA